MKNNKFLSIFLIFLYFFNVFSLNNNFFHVFAKENCNYEVEHFFTHCLLVKPELAFNNNNFMSKYNDIDCLTTDEFNNILNSLYEKNYCLVNANDCFEVLESGKAIKKKIVLPNNKKPLILSIDDVNYDHKKLNTGMAEKIAVDENNKLCSIIDGQYDYKREFISCLENFIEKHKDFSYNNAKAMLCLTGYDGILGYRTQNNNQNEIKKAQKIVDALKNNGYYFACHSYGHYHMKKISNKNFKEELNNWKTEVEPIVGKTSIYVYPYGEKEILLNDNTISEKHNMLIDYGFKLFCGVGTKHFFSYYPFSTTKENQVLFMDRRPLDGYSLRHQKIEYSDFFDCFNVYDKKNRKVLFS